MTRFRKLDDPLRSWPLYESECGEFQIRGHGRGKTKWWAYRDTGTKWQALGMAPTLAAAKAGVEQYRRKMQESDDAD